MKKTMMRILAVALLMMVSMDAGAKVNVEIGKFEGGTIKEKGQTDPDDKGLVTVTITVTPDDGYTISLKDIAVFSTYSPSGTRTDPQIAGNLTLLGKDPEDLGKSRDYSFIVASTLGAWVKEANFKSKGSKGNRDNISISDIDGLNAMTATGNYIITEDIDASNYTATISNFSGTLTAQAKEDGTYPVVSGLTKPLFNSINGGTVSNIMLKDVNINSSTNVNVGAVAAIAQGSSYIYNCGVLPTTTVRDNKGNITGFTGSTFSTTTSNEVGSIVGKIQNATRVINCFSYATITGGKNVAGIVGYIGNTSINQNNLAETPMVMNCMFYGEITGGTYIRPVYGGNSINNNSTTGVNPYNYFRANAEFDDNFTDINKYNRSWPAEEEYLTRFEYYRSILNSNRRLCTWWITGKTGTEQTDDDLALIAKWVLDPSIAPYPILKEWGKYPSIINPDPNRTWDSEAMNGSGDWQTRSTADPYRGKSFTNKLSVTVNPGGHAASGVVAKTVDLTITDMDTLNYDYGYYKVQLPYYNEVFGNPASNDHDTRYGGNYKDYVVTGWKIISTNHSGTNSFDPDWESGYNFADRDCTDKDLFDTSGRVFAQGGYYYVPEGVTSIVIEAYWGKAVYLHNSGHYIDRVNITNSSGNRTVGSPFTPAGTLSTIFQGQTVYDAWHNAVIALDEATRTGDELSLTVYDQAIVLLSNYQLRNENGAVGTDINSNKWYPYTLMSIDQDLDNEPDYCFEFQYRKQWNRNGIQPIRFDFLPVPELGLAVRHNANQNTIGIFIPQGHFEITETSFMHLMQFEYDGDKENKTITGKKVPAPIILNGGHIDQIVVRYTPFNNTQYFLMGGHFRMPRFALGAHANKNNTAKVRLCAVNAIGGDYQEFYLSGIYRPDISPNSVSSQGNPHCYTNGGRFGTMAGSGYDKILGDVTFKIDHSVIDEFYGGGINAAKPVGGSIDVTIDHSLVTKYCGGPKVGEMIAGKTVTTHATGTIFTNYYGGGNGGTSFYREICYDGNDYAIPTTEADWANIGTINKGVDTRAKYDLFNPLNTITGLDPAYDATKGYHALYEFECFVESNGIGANPTLRTFTHWAQFGITSTGNTTSVLNGCTIKNNFYGGGNMANVDGNVTSTLTDCTIEGSAFGAGFSGRIEPFRVHDKSTTQIPYIDKSGVMHNGKLEYGNTEYTWINEIPTEWNISPAPTTDNPTFTYGGKSYCYTTVPLDNLGTVTGNVTLNIQGNTTVYGKVFDENGVEISASVDRGGVFGGGDASNVTGNTTVEMTGGTVEGSVYGGANLAVVNGNTEVIISGGTVGKAGAPVYADIVGNVYGGGKGLATDKDAGLVTGSAAVTISGDAENPFIYHNVYGGGAYGSVGTFSYDANQNIIGYTSGGTCTVTVTGGKIGTTGKENGMVFGSSRGDVSRPVNGVDPNDHLAWVHDTHVIIGTANSTELTYPQINGSIYGSGENGHTYTNTVVDIHSGTVGIPSGEAITMEDGKDYDGPRFPNRGNVYGGGCGTDTYTVDEDGNGSADTNSEGKTKQYFNLNAGIVLGNCTVNIDGGHVVHNVYGAGAMGSAGTFTTSEGKPSSCADQTGVCYVNVSGGMVGMPGARMTATNGPDDFGHVFGAGRGELHDSTEYVNMNIVGYVKESHVAISGNAFITGSVYGGSESGHVLGDTYVTVSSGQIGCGENQTEAYSEQAFTNAFDDAGNVVNPLEECAHWTYDTHNSPYDKFSGDDGYEGSGGLKTATDGHTFYGNVFGGGSGYYPYAPGKWVRSAGLVEGSTHVLIEGGHILSNVYGGNEHTDVYGSCTVTMTGGTVGVPRTWSQKRAEPVLGNLFGAGKGDKRVLFNQWTNVTNTTVTVSGGMVYGSVFGGGEDGHVLGDAETTISGASTVIGTLGTTGYDGNVFGGGRGSYTALTAGVVCGNVNLNIEDGYMKGSVYGGGRLASVGTHLADVSQEDYYGRIISDGKKQIIGEDDEDAEGVTHGHITIVISGGTIGAVKDGRVLTSQYSLGDVFGGCKGTTEGTILEKLGIAKSAVVNLLGGTVGNSIYGGGEVGFVGERGLVDAPETAFAKVNLLGGSVKNVYGGGLGLKDGVGGAQSNAPALVRGNVKVNLNGLEPDDYNSTIHSSVVTGLNEDGNEGVDFYRVNNRVDGCVVTGNIFGCNNVNGTPEGHAKLHVFMTTPESRQLPEPGQTSDNYDVAAVYGGGNQADYVPTDDEQKTEVIIEGCGLTSIQQVYGGGNAAATPGTLVTVKGTELIDEVFGGGNGVSTDDFDNPGANVGIVTGTETPYTLGDGVALVRLMAGNIHYAYGGSNTKGDIRGGSSVETVDNEWIENVSTACCEELHVDEMYGGGKNAGMKSGTNIILGCSNSTNWVNEIYAGAENADVEGDCSLTITSGMFKRVFGGNKFSGKLKGSITVNIEENGQCGVPIIIGELYGGGNKAPYSVYGYDNNGSMLTSGERKYNDPVVNVRSFTSIGNIYGGGYGSGAILYGNTNVNINETLNHQADAESYSGNAYPGGVLHLVTTLEEVDVKLYPHEDGKIGVIGNVFGGGNAAAVYGNTNVNIGTTAEEPLQQLDNNGNPLYEDVVVEGVTKKQPVKILTPVVGADIQGNVYGGGNEAVVTGDTNVTIGKDGSSL